jgi:drug/metabolite transporter (DMT)-like permease
MKEKVVHLLKNKYIAVLCAILCTSLWGTAFPLIKYDYAQFNITDSDMGSMVLFAGVRFLLAGIMAFIIGLCIHPKRMMLKKENIIPVASLGFVQTFMQYLFSAIGVGMTTATNTSIITGATSLVSVIMAGIFFASDRLTVRKILGCIIGFAGIIFINISSMSFGGVTFVGDVVVFLSTICGAGGNIITKKAGKISPASMTAWQLTFGGVCLVILGLILGGKLDFTNFVGMSIIIWLAFVSAVSFLLWTVLLQYHPVSKISVFNMLVPIFGTVISGIVLGEDIFKLQNLLALVLISAGIILVNLTQNARKK